MKHMKLILITTAGLAAMAPAQTAASAAAVPDRNLSYKSFNIGMAAGVTSGYGLSYRTWNGKGTGYQFTLMPYLDLNKESQSANISAGILRTHVLFDLPVAAPPSNLYQGANIFFYYGGNYNLSYDSDTYLSPNNGSRFVPMATGVDYQGERYEHTVTAGAGIGTEFHFWIFNWSLMVGYAGSGNWEKFNYNQQVANPGEPEQSYKMRPSVETSFYFNFGGL